MPLISYNSHFNVEIRREENNTYYNSDFNLI